MPLLEFVDLLVDLLLGVLHRLTDLASRLVCLVGCGVLVRVLYLWDQRAIYARRGFRFPVISRTGTDETSWKGLVVLLLRTAMRAGMYAFAK